MEPKMKWHYYQLTDETANIITSVILEAMNTHGIICSLEEVVYCLTNKLSDNFASCDKYTLIERVQDYIMARYESILEL